MIVVPPPLDDVLGGALYSITRFMVPCQKKTDNYFQILSNRYLLEYLRYRKPRKSRMKMDCDIFYDLVQNTAYSNFSVEIGNRANNTKVLRMRYVIMATIYTMFTETECSRKKY